MKHLFYFIAFLPILWEIMVLSNPKKVARFISILRAKSKYNLTKKNYTNAEKAFYLLNLGYIGWSIAGLLSSQWVLFLIIILLGFMPKKHYITIWINSLLSLAVLIFIILNAYHFHIDVYSWVISLF